MIKTCIKRKVTVIMMTLVVLLGGMIAYNNLELAMTPNIDLPIALVSCTYTGAAPEEMEDLVTKPIEETLATLTGVDTITSSSSTGSSIVVVQFVDGTNIDTATNDMRDKLDRVKRQLPDDADDPIIMKMDMNATTINVGVTSSKYDVDTLYNLLDENVVSSFERIDGVSSVSLSGGRDDEVRVIVDQNKMENYGVTMSTISQALGAENNNITSGELKRGNLDISLRTVGQFNSIEDIKNTYIKTNSGNTIMVKDVAEVKEAKEDKESISLIDGKEGCTLSLSKQNDANIVTVTDLVMNTITKLEKQYPDFKFTIVTDTADYIKTSINNMISTAFQAAIIAVLVLLVMLRSVRMALIIGVSIPTSIFATLGLMYLTGMSLNMMSLGGVVIAIGMLVDNSVVVLENIFKKKSLGMSAFDSAYRGSSEVAMAITASTLTTVAVFLPLTFMQGTMGQLMKEISYTVCYALGASLVVALTFVPMASAVLMASEASSRNNGKISRIFNRLDEIVGNFLDKMDNAYARLIGYCLSHRIRTFLIVIFLFVASLFCTQFVGSDLMASTDEGSLSITADLPNGTDYDTAEAKMEEILAKIGEIPETQKMEARIGGGRFGSTGQSISISYDLGDKEDRTRSTDEVKIEVEEKLADVAGCEIEVSSSGNSMGSIGGSGFEVQIKGDDNDTLKDISDELVDKIAALPNAKNVESSLDDASQEAQIIINRAKASQYGLTTSAIANAVYSANSGTVATEYKTNGTEIDVRIMYPDEKIEYVKDLNNLTISTPTGITVPLTEVASIEMGESALTITRENQQKYIEISGEIEGLDTSAQQAMVTEVLDSYVFPEGYSYEFGGMMERMQETFSSLFTCIIVAILLVYMVMASQFESFVYPFIIMFSMPMAITGGFFGLLITGTTLTSNGYMGLIMLVGMVVNNGIVLVDHTNQILEKDKKIGVNDALIISGRDRLRPILMTTLTTVIGMIPVALALGSGMESQQAMGIVIVFGLTIGTLITLVFIPVLYSAINSIKNKFGRNRKNRRKVSAKDEAKEARKAFKKAMKKEGISNEV
ncbi:MAG: efflux RND transporter permease subunit [Lachnospirales bacterium]